jgi:hypothetical protein
MSLCAGQWPANDGEFTGEKHMFAGLSCLGSLAGTAVFEDVPPEGSGSGGYCGLARVLAPNSSGGVCPAPFAVAVIMGCLSAAPAPAKVTISSGATVNMICSGGTCVPTAAEATLNVVDLTSLLASGNVEVKTTGSGVQANDIQLETALTWSSTCALSLDAYRSVVIDKPVSVAGVSELTLTTNDGGSEGTLFFGAKGRVSFQNMSSQLAINGVDYQLVNSIATLANAVVANPSGDYALSANYDASGDGTYADAPVSTTFGGSFNGLGNEISHMAINDPNVDDFDGLFAETASGSSVASIKITEFNIMGSEGGAAGLVGINEGAISNAFVRGSIVTAISQEYGELLGGVASWNFGTVSQAAADVKIAGNNYSSGSTDVGGLVGANQGLISQSYATGSVSTGESGTAGGLVGGSSGTISQSYAYVKVAGGEGAEAGGLVGYNLSPIAQSYSTGRIHAPRHGNGGGYVGGFVGSDGSGDGLSSDYWDTTASRFKNQRRGAGTPKKDPGITGLTSAQLQSGLPSGFDPSVWAEDRKINDGLPYLIANPPEK